MVDFERHYVRMKERYIIRKMWCKYRQWWSRRKREMFDPADGVDL